MINYYDEYSIIISKFHFMKLEINKKNSIENFFIHNFPWISFDWLIKQSSVTDPLFGGRPYPHPWTVHL